MTELPNQNNQVAQFVDLLILNPFLETDLSSGSEHFRTFFGSSKYNFTIPKNDDFEEGSTMGSSQIESIHGELGSSDGSIHSCKSGSIQSTNDSTLASSNPIIGWMIGSSTELNGTREILVPESSSSSHLSCNKIRADTSRDSICEDHVIDTNNNYIDCETRSETTECLQAQLQYRLSNSNIRKYNYDLRDVQSEPTGSGDESISGLEGNHLARAVEEAFQDQHFQRRFAQKYYSQCLKNGLPILH